MSYILDALKKSEAERSRGAVPTLLTPPQTQFRSGVVAWVLVAVLVINAALLVGWLYWPASASNATARSPEVATPAAAPTNAPTIARTVEPTIAPVTDPVADNQPTPGPDAASLPAEVPTGVAARNPASATPSGPSAAAQDETASSADVSFSTHVYATDPSMRAVTMNGRRFVEGDTIKPGVRIREITETGVVLDVNGRPIPVDVLQDWR